MASVTCPHCTKSVNVPDGMGGKQMRCPGCRKVFPIPGETAKVAAGAPASASGSIKLAAGSAAAKPGMVKPSGPSNQGVALKPPLPVPPPPRPSGPSHGGLAPRAPAPPVQPGPPLVPRPSSQGLPSKPGPLALPTPIYPHIEKPTGQPARLQRVPSIRVSQIVMDYLAFGWSPEEMCRQHPHLAPADVHAAMGYYYDYRPEIEQEIMTELNQVGQDQAKSQPSPALLKMRMT